MSYKVPTVSKKLVTWSQYHRKRCQHPIFN